MTRIPLGEFEQEVILAILKLRGSGFSLEVRKAIEEATGKRVSRGAFYTTLERLEGKGFVYWEEAVPPGARRELPQRCFALTPKGLNVLRETRSALQDRWERMGRALEGS